MAIYRTSAFKSNFTGSSPGVNNDISQGYESGSSWTNTTTGQVFKCLDNALGAAAWSLDSDRMSELQACYAAAADRVTNVAVETAFANVKAIAASSLAAGDVIHVRAKALVVAIAAGTHIFGLRLGSVAAGTSAATSGGAEAFAAADYCIFEGTVTIAAAGAGGACHIDLLCKKMVAGVPTEVRTVTFDTALDTTIARDVTLTATPSAANVGNQVDIRELEAWVERAGTVA